MRSSWLDKWLHRRPRGGHGPVRSVKSVPLLRRRNGKKRGVRGVVSATPSVSAAPKKSVRLLLGIGDGTVRTQ